MLRLFSSIRHSLLAGNNTVKYLKYAVGEVLLIMVGIILALQFNNWNEGRKEEQERQELIENLKLDFEISLERLETEIKEAEENYKNIELLLRNSGGEPSDLTVEEIRRLHGRIMSSNAYTPAFGAYQSAMSTGVITSLGSRELNSLFIEFERRNVRLDELEDLYGNLEFSGTFQELRSQLGSSRILRVVGGFVPEKFQVNEQEFRELVARPDVYAIFDTRRHIKSRQLNNFGALKGIIEQILAELEAL